MESEVAVKAMKEFAMAVYTHTMMRGSEIALESKGMERVESQRAKMQDIKVEALGNYREKAAILLKEIPSREPTAKEIREICSILD